MTVLSQPVKLGTIDRVIKLLRINNTHLQWVIDYPDHRQVVSDVLHGNYRVGQPMTKDLWVTREVLCLKHLADFGLEMEVKPDQIERAWRNCYGFNHRFVLAGLTRPILLNIAEKLGVKLNGNSVASADWAEGEQLSTGAGVFNCNLTEVMQPAGVDHGPFMFNYDEQEKWCRTQGGDGLSSAEETLYLLSRMKLEYGQLLFMGGWIRCFNLSGPCQTLGVKFEVVDGLDVSDYRLQDRRWYCGCIPRKFTPLHL